jgi:hypothetical protein
MGTIPTSNEGGEVSRIEPEVGDEVILSFVGVITRIEKSKASVGGIDSVSIATIDAEIEHTFWLGEEKQTTMSVLQKGAK